MFIVKQLKTLKNKFSFNTDTSEFFKKNIFSDTKQNLRYSVNLEKKVQICFKKQKRKVVVSDFGSFNIQIKDDDIFRNPEQQWLLITSRQLEEI